MTSSIAAVLNIKLDDIADVSTSRQQQPKINPDDHYWVEANGTSLIVTEKREEAFSVYRDCRVQNKKIMRSYKGKLWQVMPRG
jgi:hypothetical protein